jgi:hypothetical protein
MADVINAKLTERKPVETYFHTIHGEAFQAGRLNAAVCSDCHGTHDLHGSANPASRMNRARIPETCGKCHQNVLAVYRESIHGSASAHGIKESPVCTDCHGEHTIRSPKNADSAVWTGAVTKTCSGCHESQKITSKFGLPTDRLKSYMDTYHGLASQRGDLRVANCASCHGFHDVLPSTDPRSSVHRANLADTCGRCHPGANDRLTAGWIHGPATGKHWLLAAAKIFYLIVIPLTLGFMLLHNGLDFLRKALGDAPPTAEHPDTEVRLTVDERIQHVILALTFVLLAWSGFALKFPEIGRAHV